MEKRGADPQSAKNLAIGKEPIASHQPAQPRATPHLTLSRTRFVAKNGQSDWSPIGEVQSDVVKHQSWLVEVLQVYPAATVQRKRKRIMTEITPTWREIESRRLEKTENNGGAVSHAVSIRVSQRHYFGRMISILVQKSSSLEFHR